MVHRRASCRPLALPRAYLRLRAAALHLVDPRETQATIAQTRDIRKQRGLDPETAHLTLFPEANHNAWDPAIAHDSLHVWLAERLGAR